MAKPIMRIVGLNGQLELLPDRVIITRQGFLNSIAFGFNARREIPLGAISEVVFKGAGTFALGQLEFVRVGGRSASEGREARKAAKHTKVSFSKAQQMQFIAFKEKVFEALEKSRRSGQQQP